jgi:hypothetical protein
MSYRMKNIPINKVGFIRKARQHAGWYIKIVPEGDSGYLILYTNGIDRQSSSQGYDHWVRKEDLEQYFDEANLDVEWNESHS